MDVDSGQLAAVPEDKTVRFVPAASGDAAVENGELIYVDVDDGGCKSPSRSSPSIGQALSKVLDAEEKSGTDSNCSSPAGKSPTQKSGAGSPSSPSRKRRLQDDEVSIATREISGLTYLSLRREGEVTEIQEREISSLYTLEKKLGEGTYGVVWLARDTATGGQCAVKVQPNTEADSFRNEFDIAKRLKHPSIIRLHAMLTDDSSCYLVMEMCAGGDLFSVVENNVDYEYFKSGIYSPPSISAVARFVWQMLQSIHYLHRHKICHRDIKVENYLVDSFDLHRANLKLIDFGLTTRFVKGVPIRGCVGSPMFIAPEVLKESSRVESGDKVGYDERCDVWSVGICSYFILDGGHPFDFRSCELKDGNHYSPTEDAMLSVTMDTQISYQRILGGNAFPARSVDLLKQLLQKDHTQRCSAKTVLASDAWLRSRGRGKGGDCCCVVA
jgi:serine/threonine protein kinase